MAFCPLLTQIGHGPFRIACPNRYDAPSLVSRDAMRRREFILGGAATAWSVTAHAQQNERVRRIGVFLSAASDDADVQIWLQTSARRRMGCAKLARSPTPSLRPVA